MYLGIIVIIWKGNVEVTKNGRQHERTKTFIFWLCISETDLQFTKLHNMSILTSP